jgi:hypothetical protein
MEKTWKLRVGEATNIRKRLEFLHRIENLRLGIRYTRWKIISFRLKSIINKLTRYENQRRPMI